MTDSRQLPVLFVGHGSPMNAVEDNNFTRTLAEWGGLLPQPKAILCVSAHWYVSGLYILSHPHPETIHDFQGFPETLYSIRYAAPGHPQLAARAKDLLRPASAELTEDWGLDHGTWSILLHLFPKADIPVFQISIDFRRSPQEHYDLAKKLKPLRKEGVLMIGSGNIVHNLGRIVWNPDEPPYPWAVEFDTAVKEALLRKHHDALIHYESSLGKTARLAVPTPDHYLPLLYALAVTEDTESVTFPFEGIQNASISMRAVQWS